MLVPGMKQVVDILVLLILSVATVYGCPHNIERKVHSCLVNFSNYYKLVVKSETALFTGLNVEILRTICVQFDHAHKCIEEIKQRCPQRRQIEILKAVGNTANLYKLCNRENLYEHYTISQNCFVRAHTKTTQCYNTFRTATSSLLVEVLKTDMPSIDQYCSNIDSLEGCIESHLEKQRSCSNNHQVKDLSKLLVKASLPLSRYCDPKVLVEIRPLTSAAPGTGGTRARQGLYNSNSAVTVYRLPGIVLLLVNALLLLVLR